MLKDEKKAIHLDTLVRKCGYFNTDTPVNNYYGCNHPDQEDTELDEETGKGQGRCFSFSCPIATELCPNEEPEDRDYFEGDNWKTCTDGDWMVVYGKTRYDIERETTGNHAPPSQGRGESSDERGQARAECEGGESAEL